MLPPCILMQVSESILRRTGIRDVLLKWCPNAKQKQPERINNRYFLKLRGDQKLALKIILHKTQVK
jgi:hypothetical protein